MCCVFSSDLCCAFSCDLCIDLLPDLCCAFMCNLCCTLSRNLCRAFLTEICISLCCPPSPNLLRPPLTNIRCPPSFDRRRPPLSNLLLPPCSDRRLSRSSAVVTIYRSNYSSWATRKEMSTVDSNCENYDILSYVLIPFYSIWRDTHTYISIDTECVTVGGQAASIKYEIIPTYTKFHSPLHNRANLW